MTLVDYLAEYKINTYRLSLAAGIPHSTVYRLLSGRHRPRMTTMQAISEATGGKVSRIEDFIMTLQKKSKAQVNYTPRASQHQRCDDCRHFRKPSGCTLVEGSIAPAGWCKLFER